MTLTADIDNELLPEGWEAKRSDEGLTYYIDHNNRRTTWIHPKFEQEAREQISLRPKHYQDSLSEASSQHSIQALSRPLPQLQRPLHQLQQLSIDSFDRENEREIEAAESSKAKRGFLGKMMTPPIRKKKYFS